MLMNIELSKLSSWLAIKKVTIYVNKYNIMVYNIYNIHYSYTLNIEINCSAIEQVNTMTFREIFVDGKMDWKPQLNLVSNK